MKNVKVGDTHSFALLGHSGDGKTSVGEALLHVAGATHELGSVTAGTSVLNFLPEEKERHTTIATSFYAFDTNDKHVTLVDTPGDSNFQADGRIALQGLDGGILIVNGVGAAKVGTQRMLKACKEYGIPTLAFVNGMDRDRADLSAALESLKNIGAAPALVTLPVGEGEALSGVVDLLHMKLVRPDGESDVPDDEADAARAAREELMEAVAECDDTLLEKYLEEGELSEEELALGLLTGTRAGNLTPVFAGAALAEIGIAPLLRSALELLPSESLFFDPWPGRGGCTAIWIQRHRPAERR